MAKNDLEIRESKFKITLLIDGWTCRRVKGYFAVMVTFVSRHEGRHVTKTRLLRLIASARHRADDLFEILMRYVSKKYLIIS